MGIGEGVPYLFYKRFEQKEHDDEIHQVLADAKLVRFDDEQFQQNDGLVK